MPDITKKNYTFDYIFKKFSNLFIKKHLKQGKRQATNWREIVVTLKTNKELVTRMCKKNNHKNTFFKGIGKKSTREKTEQSTRKTSVKKSVSQLKHLWGAYVKTHMKSLKKCMQIKIK